LLGAEPAVASLPDGGGVAGVAVFVGGARERPGGVAGADDVDMEVGEPVGGGAGAVVDRERIAADAADVAGPPGALIGRGRVVAAAVVVVGAGGGPAGGVGTARRRGPRRLVTGADVRPLGGVGIRCLPRSTMGSER
jgi:hypothetical protein